MTVTEIQESRASPADNPPVAASNPHGVSFDQVLSALNPLQYLPVIGSIYRVATGDVIPEHLRIGGSFVVSGVLGGPIGLITSIATTIAEKVSGIDPEQILAERLRGSMPSATEHRATSATETSVSRALTARQLAAYGVTTEASGNLRLGSVEGADVLNMIELMRLGPTTVPNAA